MSIQGKMMNRLQVQAKNQLEKGTEKLLESNNEIINRLNWVMKAQQQIANKLEVVLEDPLEE